MNIMDHDGRVALARSLAPYPLAYGCDQELNAFCAIECQLGAASTFLARLDRSATDLAVDWRCYSLSTLSADRMSYVGGTEFCTRGPQIRDLLSTHGCRAPLDAVWLPPLAGLLKSGYDEVDLRSLRARFRRGTRVAVVGSSGNLRWRGHGHQIDRYEIV